MNALTIAFTQDTDDTYDLFFTGPRVGETSGHFTPPFDPASTERLAQMGYWDEIEARLVGTQFHLGEEAEQEV